MRKRWFPGADRFVKQNRQRRAWKKLVRCLACVVVFCTTYTLILPAITMESVSCESEEHIHSEHCYGKVSQKQIVKLACTYASLDVHNHTDDCMDEEGQIICGFADYLVHVHDASCREESGTVVCQLPEIMEHTHTDDCYKAVEETAPEETEHIHDESCFTIQRGALLCQIEETAGHMHTESCYTRGDLLCQKEEAEAHTHAQACSETVLICTLTTEPHTHTESCYRQPVCELSADPVHVHDETCSGQVLECELTEQEHIHNDSCYRTNFLCDLPESEGHAHTEECYAQILTCGLEAAEGHRHTDSCYEQIRVLNCRQEETTPAETEGAEETAAPKETEPEVELVCEKAVIKLHSHTDACYETYLDENEVEQKRLICTEPVVLEHIHGESCFVTEEVPAEDADKLTCTLTEGHIHGEGCFDDAGSLICTEVENHTHSEMCYGTWELICGKEEHTHTDACRIPTYYCAKEEHSHGEACYDPEGNPICGLEEHTHTEDCLTETVCCCGLEEHTHGETCWDENGELVCGLEEHTHTDACYGMTGETEIPLIRPLLCTMEAHTHEAPCFGEDPDGEPICGLAAHAHTDDCYGTAVAVFPYEDDQLSMTVTVASDAGLPEGLSMEVLLLSAQDRHYSAYAGYAAENAGGELLGLTGYQVRFLYEGQEIQLEDAQITAELTVRPAEYQTAAEPGETEPVESPTGEVSALFTEEGISGEPVLMSMRAGEPAGDRQSENGTEDTEVPETVIITVLQQGEEEIINHGSTTFSETQTRSDRITLSLTGNTTFALARQVLANPDFTVQYYANFPRMQYLEEKPADNPYVLDVIDTRGNGDGTGGNLPVNGAGKDNPGTKNGVMYLQLREVPGLEDSQMHETLGQTVAGKKIFEVLTNLEQTRVYKDYPLTYVSGLGIEHMDKLQVNTHYNLVDLWISRDGGATWTVYTTVPIGAVVDYAPEADDTVTIPDGVDPYVSQNEEVFGQWYHGLNAGINDHLWFRKFRQNAGDEVTIAIPHEGDVTHLVRVDDIHALAFTNNPENTDAIRIEDSSIIRLVYDLPRHDQSLAVNFFDYDISDTSVYVSATESTSERPVLETDTKYIYSNANQATYELNDYTWEPYTTFNDRLYMKTSDTVDGVDVAYGINSAQAYHNAGTAYFAFGNQNTGVFRRYDTLNGYYINGANSGSFKGCSFGLAKGLINGQPFLELADGIAHQALFNEEALYGSGVPGKTTYSRQQLVFRRMGDTYILTDVNRDLNNGIKESRLNQFIAPGYTWPPSDGIIQFTNNFWPMDGTVGDTVDGHDMVFGGIDEAKDRWFSGVSSDLSAFETGYGYFPDSDDGMPHNSYFGMAFSVEFQMDGEYCGPLEYLFFGDDDMWVFLTNVDTGETKQICDIGGVHGSVGSFTDLWDYISGDEKGTYRLDFFYTERGATGSTCYMEFTLPNMASIPQIVPETGSVRVKKEVPNATVNEEFTFLFDLEGNFADNLGYSHTDSTGKLLGGTIRDGDTFTLKQGETISISGIPKGMKYTITEQLGENQTYNVTWKRQGASAVDDPGIVSGTVENGITHTYICTNEALGSLEVEKTVKGLSAEDIAALGTAFPIDITLTNADGTPLSGTFGIYEFDPDGRITVNLKHGQKAVFTDIPVGTGFTVQEQKVNGFLVSYMLGDEIVRDADGLTAAGASGTIRYNETVSIDVVNATGYELPETGGAGTTTYTMAGLVLICFGMAYLMYKPKARGKGES